MSYMYTTSDHVSNHQRKNNDNKKMITEKFTVYIIMVFNQCPLDGAQCISWLTWNACEVHWSKCCGGICDGDKCERRYMCQMCSEERRDVFFTRMQPNLASPCRAPLCTFSNTLSIYIWQGRIKRPILINASKSGKPKLIGLCPLIIVSVFSIGLSPFTNSIGRNWSKNFSWYYRYSFIK